MTADQNPAASPTDHNPDAEQVGVARATGVIAAGNITSRMLGLGREMLLSNLFGAGIAVDAFNIAILVPKMLYDLLIGGHVNSALVPVLSEYAMDEDRVSLWQLVNLLLGLVVVALAVLVLLIEVFAPSIIRLISGDIWFGAQPLATTLLPQAVMQTASRSYAMLQTQELATQLLRITTPALIFLSLFAVLSGLLNALRRFVMPAFAGAMFNGSIVIVTLIAAPQLGIGAMAIGWLIGAAVQMMAQMIGLRDANIRLAFSAFWRDPGVRRIALLYLPVLLSLIIDTMMIRLVSYRLAAQVGPASISYMNFATTLMQFPHGLVATAISVAILPTLSRQAIQLAVGGVDVYKNTLGRGMRLAIVLILPATIGLFVLAVVVVGLLFGHGNFTPIDTANTSLALRLYLIGLPFATLDTLLIFAFYSQQDTLTPAIVGIISLGAYLAVALGLMPHFGLFSLMIADSTKHMLHASISAYLLSKRIGGYDGQRLPQTTIKTLFAAVLMGICTYFAQSIITGFVPANTIGEIIVVFGAAVVGIVVFAGMAALLRIDELLWIITILRQRFAR